VGSSHFFSPSLPSFLRPFPPPFLPPFLPPFPPPALRERVAHIPDAKNAVLHLPSHQDQAVLGEETVQEGVLFLLGGGQVGEVEGDVA
jgi:hypothetical protein